MPTCTRSPVIARSRLRIIGLSIATLLVCSVLLGSVFTGGAQAAVSYSTQEIAFINQLNQYRAANGLQPLLLSDMITEACDRHGSDMGKYAFFSHYSLKSDWFAYNALPWDRMTKSGYGYYTSKAENIAAGQVTGADVFTAWKNSAGHNANMLGSAYKVIGVSQMIVPGSPYTYYWTTDFGGYVDATAHAPGQTAQPPAPPAPTATRYQQNDSRLAHARTWSSTSTSYASGGSFRYINASGASVTATFSGTSLTWIAKKSPVYGRARVTLDNNAPVYVDLYSSSTKWQQKVWTTGTQGSGIHTVKIEWTGTRNAAATACNVSSDAFDVVGTLVQAATTVSPVSTTLRQQTDSHFIYAGTWYAFSTTSASGGSYKRANTSGAAVTVNFTGTCLDWIATRGTTLGKAFVSLDGGPAVSVNLAASTVAYQQKVWSTGTLPAAAHTVKIWWDPSNIAGKYISIDAFNILGTLN